MFILASSFSVSGIIVEPLQSHGLHALSVTNSSGIYTGTAKATLKAG